MFRHVPTQHPIWMHTPGSLLSSRSAKRQADTISIPERWFASMNPELSAPAATPGDMSSRTNPLRLSRLGRLGWPQPTLNSGFKDRAP